MPPGKLPGTKAVPCLVEGCVWSHTRAGPR